MYLVSSLLVLRAGCGIWLCPLLIITYFLPSMFEFKVDCEGILRYFSNKGAFDDKLKVSCPACVDNYLICMHCFETNICSFFGHEVSVAFSPRPLGTGMHFQTLLSPLLKVPRIVLISSRLWWELGTSLPGPGPGEWMSFWRVTSKQFWFTDVWCDTSGSKWRHFRSIMQLVNFSLLKMPTTCVSFAFPTITVLAQ